MNNNTKTLIQNKYQIQKYINKGAFGSVFQGINRLNQKPVAIKMEMTVAGGGYNILLHEVNVLNFLSSRNCSGIPPIYWFGKHMDNPCLIMPFYSCSLYDMAEEFHKTVATAANQTINKQPAITLPQPIAAFNTQLNQTIKQMVAILQAIHEAGIVHRDIKPQNIMIDGDRIVLIDFGLASVITPPTPQQTPTNQSAVTEPPPLPTKSEITGSPLWVSLNVLMGYKPGKRDDLISLAYTYLLLQGCGRYKQAFQCNTLNDLRHRKSWETLSTQQGAESVENVFVFLQQVYLLGENETPNYTTLMNILQ